MVSLPLKPAAALHEAPGGDPSRNAAERLSVLIVEDNLDGRESLRELIARRRRGAGGDPAARRAGLDRQPG
jgi:hypothetical protein